MSGRISGEADRGAPLAYPVRDANDAVVGVLALGLNLARLQTLFSDIALPDGSVVTLTDTAGRVLARSQEPERFIGQTARRSPLRPSDVPRTQTLVALDGVQRFFGNAVVDRGPWLLSVGIPTRVAADRMAVHGIQAEHEHRLGVSSPSPAVLIMALVAVAQRLTNSLNRVRHAIQRIADGDLSPPPRMPLPNREITRLYAAFTTMAASLA